MDGQQEKASASVTIAATVNGETTIFSSDGTTEGNVLFLVEGLLRATGNEAEQWVLDLKRAARGF